VLLYITAGQQQKPPPAVRLQPCGRIFVIDIGFPLLSESELRFVDVRRG
jgi:hypothetical protein